MSSFHNGKVEYCAIFGSGDIEENASVIFFTQTLVFAAVRPPLAAWLRRKFKKTQFFQKC